MLEWLKVLKADTGPRKPMRIQSLIFDKSKFSREEAVAWAKNHDYKSEVDETGGSYRMRQREPGGMSKMRTISITSGVKAVVGKAKPVKKGQPSSSSVHVPSTDIEIPAQHKQPARLSKEASRAMLPSMTAGELHQHFQENHDTVGGTVKTGKAGSESDGEPSSERFIFGPMTFDIDQARKIGGKEANATVKVSPDWSHQINVDTKAALESNSDNPVMVAQVPTTNGIEQLLIDGHHRMHRAMHEGKEELPAHIFSPEETMKIVQTHPDLMSKMQAHLKDHKPTVSTEDPGDGGKVAESGEEDEMEAAREEVATEDDPTLELKTAQKWCARAIAALEQGDNERAQDYGHEALEHAAMVMDNGETVSAIQDKLEEAGMYGGVDKETLSDNRSSGGMGDNALAGLYSMQEIVSGMDWELAHDTTDPDLAKEMALSNLEQDPNHYRKLRITQDEYDWGTACVKDTQEGEELFTHPGLMLDLGSGPQREPGFIGLDLEKHDHGTIVYDLHQGIPLPDASVKCMILRDSLHDMDELSKDPKPLLAEAVRTLKPGGQLIYSGPNQLNNMPEGLVETFSEKFRDQQERSNRVGKIEGQPRFRQEFARIASPDAATSNDSEPRIGVAQYDMLPADALLAMDALGYYWSDATSSGRGNRLHGYPSQGALVQRSKDLAEVALEESTKGGPGSGRHAEGGADRDKQRNEAAAQRLARQAAGDAARWNAQRMKKSFSEKTYPIFKADNEKQVVYGVVLEPNDVDLQEDWMKPEEIEKTAHFFMMNGRTIGKSHETVCKAIPVESYIAPVDFACKGQYGDQTVKKGSWVIGVKVLDPSEWEKVKSGEYTGFSVGGWGKREDSEGPVEEQW